MKRSVFLLVVVSLFAADLRGQNPFLDCGTTGTGNHIVPMINVTQPFVAVFVDFADGRLGNGNPPADTKSVSRFESQCGWQFWVDQESTRYYSIHQESPKIFLRRLLGSLFLDR